MLDNNRWMCRSVYSIKESGNNKILVTMITTLAQQPSARRPTRNQSVPCSPSTAQPLRVNHPQRASPAKSFTTPGLIQWGLAAARGLFVSSIALFCTEAAQPDHVSTTSSTSSTALYLSSSTPPSLGLITRLTFGHRIRSATIQPPGSRYQRGLEAVNGSESVSRSSVAPPLPHSRAAPPLPVLFDNS